MNLEPAANVAMKCAALLLGRGFQFDVCFGTMSEGARLPHAKGVICRWRGNLEQGVLSATVVGRFSQRLLLSGFFCKSLGDELRLAPVAL